MGPVSMLNALILVTALTVLVLAILFARAVRGTGPSRARRILIPPLIFVLGTMAVLGLPSFFPVAGDIPFQALAETFLWLALLGLLAAGIAEGIVAGLNVERTSQALTAGIAISVIAFYALIVSRSGAFI